MLFNSFQFIYFFTGIVFLYFLMPAKYRWVLLLAGSYYFYMCWKAEYIILILVSTMIDYTAGIRIGRSSSKMVRKTFLLLSILTNLGLLFAFKYFNFFNDSLRAVFDHFNIMYNVPYFKVLLPVGISFYTFQTLSYTFDVYMKKREPEYHIGYFALYVAFFPQLVAGPIERSTNLLPELRKVNSFDYKRVTDGLKLMAWGLFKKIVIADRVAIYVNQVYNDPGAYSGWPVIVATYFFAIQIYCDFSGYSDIAIGAANVMGYNLMDNFRRPYFSKTIPEFWKRWHISLSTWFRDYLYIPLGGNRVNAFRRYLNVFLVFVISGLWHGANWTFVIWGALHGFYQIVTMLINPFFQKIYAGLGIGKRHPLRVALAVFITFHLVCFSWIFFRANNLSDAFVLIGSIPAGLGSFAGVTLSLLKEGFITALLSIGLLLAVQIVQRHRKMRHFLDNKPLVFRWALYVMIVLFIVLFAVDKGNQFIYFQF